MDVRTISGLMKPDSRTTMFGPRGLMLDRRMLPEASARFVQRMIARSDLTPNVPKDVRDYFETARKLHVYGAFVYEFFALAADRAFFACEFALRERYKVRGAAPAGKGARPITLRRLLKWAMSEGLLPSERDEARLLVLADLRNFGAHPDMNRIVSPADSARMIGSTAQLINELWGPSDGG